MLSGIFKDGDIRNFLNFHNVGTETGMLDYIIGKVEAIFQRQINPAIRIDRLGRP